MFDFSFIAAYATLVWHHAVLCWAKIKPVMLNLGGRRDEPAPGGGREARLTVQASLPHIHHTLAAAAPAGGPGPGTRRTGSLLCRFYSEWTAAAKATRITATPSAPELLTGIC